MRLLLALLLFSSQAFADAPVLHDIVGDAAKNFYSKLTRSAWCEGQTIYQSHYRATSTTSTDTFVLASPTAVGKTIHVLALHVYSVQATMSAAGICEQRARDSLTGVTVSTSSMYFPSANPQAVAQEEIDIDGIDMWGPCGWMLSVGALIHCNLTTALTGGQVVFHTVWFEE